MRYCSRWSQSSLVRQKMMAWSIWCLSMAALVYWNLRILTASDLVSGVVDPGRPPSPACTPSVFRPLPGVCHALRKQKVVGGRARQAQGEGHVNALLVYA